MIFKNEKQILNIIKYAPPLFIFVIIILILSTLFIEKNRTFTIERAHLVKDFEIQNKQLIKDQVQSVYNFIIREQKLTEENLKKSLKEALDNAHTIMSTIYKNNQDKSDHEIKKLIHDALVNIRFNNGRGYFFIFDKKGMSVMHPILPSLEQTNMYQHQDAKGTYLLQEMIELLQHQDEVFYEWYWKESKEAKQEKKKIGLFRNFEPYDWFIGTGEYVQDFEKEVQQKVLQHVQKIRYGDNGYIFIVNYDTIYLSHIRPEYIGKNVIKINDAIDTKSVIEHLIQLAKQGEGYYSYVQTKRPSNEQTAKKTSYVKGLDNWAWMIGTGYYEDDLEELIKTKKAELDKRYSTYLSNSISIAVLLSFILLLFSIYLSKKLQEKFERYKKEIEEQIKDNQQQQNIMFQQSKMAAMGEMIGNIAHQWRQPLSNISTTATGIQIQKELQTLDDQQLNEGLENIHQATQFLSHTIDDFRNFFSLDKKEEKINLQSTIEKAIALISVQFHNKNVQIIQNIKPIEIVTYENELIQVVINILNNARDELLSMQELQRLIFIDIYEQDQHAIIEIKDNAGGIDKEIIDRIFEPYFTTKHQAQGTGIGLFMSQEIITKNMNGQLKVQNQSFSYNNQTFTGAMFTIKLPKHLMYNDE